MTDANIQIAITRHMREKMCSMPATHLKNWSQEGKSLDYK